MYRDVSLCNTYNYGDAFYWDSRYMEEGSSAAFDWYQRYSALRPFLLNFVAPSSRVLMVGCGNAVMSEDMAKDGYIDIMNVDISSIVIDMMRKKYANLPQLKYIQMDARDMSFFEDESFDCVIDKGTLDSLMCGTDAPLGASQMLEEVNRLLKPGGIYMLITYGDPSVRVPHLSQAGSSWKITLYIILKELKEACFKTVVEIVDMLYITKQRLMHGAAEAHESCRNLQLRRVPIPQSRPGYQSCTGNSSTKSVMEHVPLTERGLLPASFVIEDPDSHYVYVCRKMPGLSGSAPMTPNQG